MRRPRGPCSSVPPKSCVAVRSRRLSGGRGERVVHAKVRETEVGLDKKKHSSGGDAAVRDFEVRQVSVKEQLPEHVKAVRGT